MLHSLPALLNDLERKLVEGRDPLPLINSIRWAEVIDWPRTREDAARLKERLARLTFLINGLHAPVRATLMRMSPEATYVAKGGANLPQVVSFRSGQSV
jgi:hypothetical protein